ncbi:MAG: acyl-CoA thioesterase domain-containing protein [Anderseniella sp.]|jgi:acyl-CoA thioesterase-2|nr:acyl-CoA thioesterase domain-containing protein [Anderseniella sp.]
MAVSEYDLVISSFHLEQLEDNLFRSRSPAMGWRRIYGGLLLAHAARAAQLTVPADKNFHALHGNFLRPGNTAEPIMISVERLLDGRSIVHRRLTLHQLGKPVFVASISFRSESGGLYFAPDMPAAPDPESLLDEATLCGQYASRLSENALKYLSRPKVFELRPVRPEQFLFAEDEPGKPMLMWFRLRAGQVPDSVLNTALLAYLSDMPVLNASLRPHGRNFFDPALSMASLDHALWQHAEPDWSDWLLATHDSLATEAGMGLGHVRIYNRSGRLCATVSQQGFIRVVSE